VLKVSEVYQKQLKTVTERPDGSEQVGYGTHYLTRECLINRDYIVSVRPYEHDSDLAADKMAEFFPRGTKFTALTVDGNSFRKSELLVVGSFEKFCSQLEK
jgi:hypothetical protein